ncbi:MAG TPA: hypothetical protein VFH68_22775 [Polyangia bacterium]|nr:hypothetical protein [Polyangia bacterium]
MRAPALLTLGLLLCAACGGKVVSADGRTGVELPPSVRGTIDGSAAAGPDTATPPPPPVDAGPDLAPRVDLRPARDLGVAVIDSAPDVVLGARCNVALGNCPNGSYCFVPNCGVNGNCVVADTTTQQDPVCGCDRITYWNGAVAAANNASVRAAGACPANLSTTCGGQPGPQCPFGSLCNLEQENNAACVAAATGRCWTLPDVCPALPDGTLPNARRCVGGGGNAPCLSVCELITTGRVFRIDDTCP